MPRPVRAIVSGEGEERLWEGTGIVYRKWVRPREDPGPGGLVHVVGKETGVEACALWEPRGPVALRVVAHWGCPYRTPEEALRDRLESSLRAREKAGLAATGSYRLVNSDGDLLSGLIVDVFAGKVAVAQSSSVAIDAHMSLIARLLREITGVEAVYEKSVQRSRRNLGLEPRRRWLIGHQPRVVVEEWGARFVVDVEMGQKTGFYLDQRMNRRELRQYVAEGDRVLDVFSYTGAFGIHAALAGAREVVFVEEDPEAVRLLRENLRLNRVERYRIVNETLWTAMVREQWGSFDVVIVDPPAFIQSGDRESIRKGMRAYYRAYKWAAQRLRGRGLLYLSSCSYFLDRDRFVRLVSRVLGELRADYRMLGSLRGAAPDHVHRGAEYLDYLKGAFIVVDRVGERGEEGASAGAWRGAPS